MGDPGSNKEIQTQEQPWQNGKMTEKACHEKNPTYLVDAERWDAILIFVYHLTRVIHRWQTTIHGLCAVTVQLQYEMQTITHYN